MTGAAINEGDRAPDFSLKDQEGRTVALHDFRGLKCVVLYFYVKDFTPGCTAETRTFSANYGALQEMDAEVLGISSDSNESHDRFAGECEARFPLLSDRGGEVRRLYGVKASLGLLPGRTTFVVDKEGVVRKVFTSQMHPRRHVSEAVEAVKRLC